ncbi:cell wall hydrolase [Rhodovibrio salinarum]|nr:cell wall hydrolase [Rhodovibrio salinarum]
MTTEMGIAAPTRAARRRRLPGLVALGLLGGVAAFVAPHLAAANDADAPTRPGSIDVRQQIQCLAKTIYFEARGEPDAGKLAVGHVVMNRVASDDYPDTVCEVMQQGGEDNLHRCQFSFYCDGRSDDPEDKAAWRHSQALARAVFWDFSPDPTGGARWYHADYVSPDWRNQFDKGPVIGQHVFYLAPGDHESETDTDAGSPQQVAERPEPEQDKLAGATNETSPSSP